MAENDVFLSSYGKIRLDLPNGKTVEAKPLPLEEAADSWLGLCITAMDDDDSDNPIQRRVRVVDRYKAIRQIAMEFPKLFATPEAFSDLTPGEVVAMAMAFFMGSPTRNGQRPTT